MVNNPEPSSLSPVDKLLLKYKNTVILSVEDTTLILKYSNLPSWERGMEQLRPLAELGWAQAFNPLHFAIVLRCPESIPLGEFTKTIQATVEAAGYQVIVEDLNQIKLKFKSSDLKDASPATGSISKVVMGYLDDLNQGYPDN